jgi:tRNA dimethylallyltransferase
MLEEGLLEEAAHVLSLEGGQTALQAIGYKELKPYLDGELPLETAVENMKQGTRRYAKRQLTWFRREPDIQWLYPDDYKDGAQLLKAAQSLIWRWAEREGIPDA